MHSEGIETWLDSLWQSRKRKRASCCSSPGGPPAHKKQRQVCSLYTQPEFTYLVSPKMASPFAGPDRPRRERGRKTASAPELPVDNRGISGHSQRRYPTPISLSAGNSYDAASSKSGSRKSGEGPSTSDSVYRAEVLRPNGIIVGTDVPASLRRTVEATITRARASEEPDARPIINDLRRSANVNEASHGARVVGYFFPEDYAAHSMLVERQPFRDGTMPTGPDDEVHQTMRRWPVKKATPDVTYGYAEESDDRLQMVQLQRVRDTELALVCRPLTDVYRPYLVVEFKTTKGNFWTVTNQAAGGGSACVKAARTLAHLANTVHGRESSSSDSIAYAATVVGSYATLYIHWSEETVQKYHMSELYTYDLAKVETVLEFRRHIRNILDWGLGERYAMQKHCLEVLADDLMQTSRPPKRSADVLSSDGGSQPSAVPGRPHFKPPGGPSDH